MRPNDDYTILKYLQKGNDRLNRFVDGYSVVALEHMAESGIIKPNEDEIFKVMTHLMHSVIKTNWIKRADLDGGTYNEVALSVNFNNGYSKVVYGKERELGTWIDAVLVALHEMGHVLQFKFGKSANPAMGFKGKVEEQRENAREGINMLSEILTAIPYLGGYAHPDILQVELGFGEDAVGHLSEGELAQYVSDNLCYDVQCRRKRGKDIWWEIGVDYGDYLVDIFRILKYSGLSCVDFARQGTILYDANLNKDLNQQFARDFNGASFGKLLSSVGEPQLKAKLRLEERVPMTLKDCENYIAELGGR